MEELQEHIRRKLRSHRYLTFESLWEGMEDQAEREDMEIALISLTRSGEITPSYVVLSRANPGSVLRRLQNLEDVPLGQKVQDGESCYTATLRDVVVNYSLTRRSFSTRLLTKVLSWVR